MKIKKSELKSLIYESVLSELYRLNILNENKEGKNLKKARNAIRKYCKCENEDRVWEYLNNTKKEVPFSRIYDFKYLRGVIRLIFNEDLETIQIDTINTILEILKDDISLAEKYDGDFNGLYYEELSFEFFDLINELIRKERESIEKLRLKPSNQYKVYPIKTFQDANRFSNYTDWCITKSNSDFNQYTSHNQSFYFIIRDDFTKTKSPERFSVSPNTDAYKDSYGLSMVAVSVNSNGQLFTSTSRHNEGISGNRILDTKEISILIGRNFYDVCKPFN